MNRTKGKDAADDAPAIPINWTVPAEVSAREAESTVPRPAALGPKRTSPTPVVIGVVLLFVAAVGGGIATGAIKLPEKKPPKVAAPPPPPPAAPAPPQVVDFVEEVEVPVEEETEERRRARALVADAEKRIEAGEIQPAFRLLAEAERVDRTYGRVHRAYGVAYALEGNAPRARRAYERYLELDPLAADAADVRRILGQ